MKKLLPMTLLTIAATTATAGAQSLSGVELGLTGGYAYGLSGEFFVHAPNVAGPVGVKAGCPTPAPPTPLTITTTGLRPDLRMEQAHSLWRSQTEYRCDRIRQLYECLAGRYI